jgi:hypothetical protein
MSRLTPALVLAVASLLASFPAFAAVVVGVRVFPVTVNFDDPGVGDELRLPQLVWQRDAGPENFSQLQWEWDKTITPMTALVYNQGYGRLQAAGTKTHSGFENAFVTGKWQAYTDIEREFVISLGVMREFGGGRTAENIDGDAYGSTAPAVWAGKGLGDYPIGALRPLAITGQLSYAIPDRPLNSALNNDGNPPAWNAGLSIQYSIPYLESQVQDHDLPPLLGHLIPLVEAIWYSPARGPAGDFPATLTIAPGVIYFADTYQVSIEALIPANRAAGTNVGVVAHLHVFFDDMFPDNIIGKPIFE